MIKNIKSAKTNRSGFYTVEAAIALPLVLLAILSVGCFLRADALWENSMNGFLDECSYSAAVAGSGPGNIAAASRVRERLEEDVPQIQQLSVLGGINTCKVSGQVHLSLPLGFGHDYVISGQVRYHDFTGIKYSRTALGTEGLENDVNSKAVWIFPLSGTKYHTKNCTYVKATVHSCILSNAVRKMYSPCHMCNSGSMSNGALVFCFYGENTSYHRGNCRSINRHTIVIDINEAEKKGYRPCTKCGG